MTLLERDGRSFYEMAAVQPLLDKVQPFIEFATSSIFATPVARRPEPLDTRRFIPVAGPLLLAALERELGKDAAGLRPVLKALAYRRHVEHRARLNALEEHYLPFCPDNDMLVPGFEDAKAASAGQQALIGGLAELLDRANFTRIDEGALNALLDERSPYGLHLHVDLDDFDEALVFARGTTRSEKTFRDPWRLYLVRQTHTQLNFQRLFLALKLRPFEDAVRHVAETRKVPEARARRIVARRRAQLDGNVSERHVYMKLFKELPQSDLEMVFPNIQIGFRPFDKLRISVLAGGGTLAGAVSAATKALAAASPLAIAGALAAFGLVLWRQLKTILITRNEYMMTLAQNLFFHALAGNRGALALVADDAEEEDMKECLLLYAFLARHGEAGAGGEEAARAIDAWLRERFGVEVRFDLADALRDLVEDGLVEPCEAGWRAVPPQAAQARLREITERIVVDGLAAARMSMPAAA